MVYHLQLQVGLLSPPSGDTTRKPAIIFQPSTLLQVAEQEKGHVSKENYVLKVTPISWPLEEFFSLVIFFGCLSATAKVNVKTVIALNEFSCLLISWVVNTFLNVSFLKLDF